MIADVFDVLIYNSTGYLLDEETTYTLSSGDYVECRVTNEEINSVYPPRYIWHRYFDPFNDRGPKQMRFPNTDEEYSRYVNITL